MPVFQRLYKHIWVSSTCPNNKRKSTRNDSSTGLRYKYTFYKRNSLSLGLNLMALDSDLGGNHVLRCSLKHLESVSRLQGSKVAMLEGGKVGRWSGYWQRFLRLLLWSCCYFSWGIKSWNNRYHRHPPSYKHQYEKTTNLVELYFNLNFSSIFILRYLGTVYTHYVVYLCFLENTICFKENPEIISFLKENLKMYSKLYK